MPQYNLENFSPDEYKNLGYTLNTPQFMKGANMHILLNTETTVSLLIRSETKSAFSIADINDIHKIMVELQKSSVVTLLEKHASSESDALVYVLDTQCDIAELLCWIQKAFFAKFYRHVHAWALTYSTNKVLGDYSATSSYRVSAQVYRNISVENIDDYISHNLIHYEALMSKIAQED
jgi:hypothetical protein